MDKTSICFIFGLYDISRKASKKLDDRMQENALRKLNLSSHLIDFATNDYLGFSVDQTIFESAQEQLVAYNLKKNGSTGSRLLSGNHQLFDSTEKMISDFHEAESALLFNSGYDANIGFFSAVPQRGDIILYDELIHASIRDGVHMSQAKAYKFNHNDIKSLEKKIQNTGANPKYCEIYIVTESIFSMDGDAPNLKKLADFCSKNDYHLIIDEAHATGVIGPQGEGLVQKLQLQDRIFARICTFGKALGCHGAAILGSATLRTYLLNYARSFIYTTALPPHAVATILSGYSELKKTKAIRKLQENIAFFNQNVFTNKLTNRFIASDSAIHCCIFPGNTKVKQVASFLNQQGFDVKPILSPTVKKGEERLRFCLHSYNSKDDISEVLSILATFAK